MFYRMIFGLAIILAATTVIGAPHFKESSVKLPRGVVFDCLLLKYYGNSAPENAGFSYLKRLEGGRVVTYPSGFVPILVSERLAKKLKRDYREEVLILSPSIERAR